MKLRNKKTGEIKECVVLPVDSNGYPNEFGVFEKGDSLAELNADWEDAPEEPKEYWYINTISAVGLHTRTNGMTDSEDSYMEDRQLEIGNYFETKEEAEKAVEKLKAWKRLKDKGFRFDGWNWKTQCIDYNLDYTDITEEQIEEAEKDLDTCFGSEE